MSATLKLAIELIQQPSITPADLGCQALMMERLAKLGFTTEPLNFEDVENFWAIRGTGKPLIVFAGHTDVVPTGPEDQWQYPPFCATVADGMLHGRGAADMKGSLAAMVTAVEQFVEKHPDHSGAIGFLITSDEEGPAINGTVKVMEHLEQIGVKIDHCIIGEPSSTTVLGDVIKVGRRGSLNGSLVIKGKQGHVAYPHLANNPVPLAARFIAAIDDIEWDQGNDAFPPTTFQISNINAGTGAANVIPGDLSIEFNFRFSPESTTEGLQQQVEALLDNQGFEYNLQWKLSGKPFQTKPGELIDATSQAIKSITGIDTEPTTTGGTSDGRFIAPYGVQVVELGPRNATIHKINECVSVADLDQLSEIYEDILVRLLTD